MPWNQRPQILELKGLTKAEQQEILAEMSRKGLLDEKESTRFTSGAETNRRIPAIPDMKWGGKFDKFKLKIKDSAKGSQALKRFQGKFNLNLNLNS